MKVAILAGGPSCERDVSLVSGAAVRDALTRKGFNTLMVDPVDDFMPRVKAFSPDIVFIALHGTFGEDGTVQRMLEQAGLPYTGSGPEASERSFDKAKAQAIFKKAGLLVPEYRVVRNALDLQLNLVKNFPLVVKPARSGSSVGISIIQRAEELDEALRQALKYSDEVLLEECIRGREMTVGIVGAEALPVVEVIPLQSFYNYEAKYGNAGTRYDFPAKISEASALALQRAALKAFEALGCEVMGRADFILTPDGRAYLLEMNTIPGLTGKSLLPKAAQARGVDFDELCVRMITLSMSLRGASSRG